MSADESVRALARRFTLFAERECTEDALYVALCHLLASRPQALRLLHGAHPSQQRPNLLLAALHHRVLGGDAVALRPYYASVGGDRAPDAALSGALDAVLHDEQAAIAALIARRTTQTNEIGRCAVLWPSLIAIAHRHAASRIVLLDFGCSAGLNLGVDAYRYDYGAFALGAARTDRVPHIACRLLGPKRPDPGRAPPRIVQRLGIDPAPVRVADDDQVAWLRACLWPGDRERRQRLDQAAALARREAWPVRQVADCAAAIEPWLDSIGDPQTLPVVFNSWVLMYFEPAARQRHIEFMRALTRRRRFVWLSAEHHSLPIGDGPAPPAAIGDPVVADDEVANGSLWWAVEHGRARALARSHPHGRWLQWLEGI